ncbi:MAG: hypothetical protein J7K87_00775 [Candidatus Aenigmarchaeota archaeon]|nr:hypothetical protein [Candidatus Aenigmarchaeota archaeon]
MNAREEYEKLRKEYKMPKLKELENIFAFRLSKDSETPLFDISKGILESIEYAQEILESLLFLNEGSKPSHFYEARFIDKKKCFHSYRKILELRWMYITTYFNSNESALVNFIKKSYTVWVKNVKDNLIELGDKMIKGWKSYREGKEKEKQTYLG